MQDDKAQKKMETAIAELLQAWLPLLDQIEQPNTDDSQLAIKLTDIFSASPLGPYWWKDRKKCQEPLLFDIVDVIIGMDDPSVTPTLPWETYESIHGPKPEMALSNEQCLWVYRQQAWTYICTLIYILQQRYLPESIPEQYKIIDEGIPIKNDH